MDRRSPRRRRAPASAAARCPVTAWPRHVLCAPETPRFRTARDSTSWPRAGRARARAAPPGCAMTREHAAHDVDDRRAGAQRLARRPGHVGEPGHELHHLVERRAVLVGAGEKALERAVDQARVDSAQAVIAAAEPLHGAGRVVLDHHVGGRRRADAADARPSAALRSSARLRLLRLNAAKKPAAKPASRRVCVAAGAARP